MNEKKSPDEEHLEDGFNEDFDFGEGETETRPIQTTTSPGLNKKIISGIFIVIFAVIVIMGYRILSPSKPLKSTNLTAEQKSTPAPEPKAKTPTTTPPASEQNFNDIAQAFSTTDQPSSPSTATQKTNTIEGSLATLQKELFALEPAPATHAPEGSEASQLTQGLNKLNQQIDYILNQIKHLDSYSREVSENLNKLNDAISVMDNRLSALTNTTSTLSKDVGSVKSEVGHVKQVLKEDGLDINLGVLPESKQREGKGGTITIEEPEYTVHAVIPGRAWLKSTKGQIITVAEGDAIGNYGKILVIDAANGVVLTSSGIAFR